METEPLQPRSEGWGDLHKRAKHSRRASNEIVPQQYNNMFRNIYQIFSRRKLINDSSESKLAKVLSAFDLTALGVGSTLGVGVYVLAGEVSKNTTGPAVILSFLIAAIASVFAGLCYAEFGARVPKAGSAYIYSYVTIGEFIAFVIGWNLILEYAIGSASVVKGLSTYLDSLLGYKMKDFFITNVPMNISGLSEYPDFFAFGVTILFSIALAFGAKESSFFNNIFTITNLCVVLFVVIAGLFKVNADNWRIPAENVPTGYGTGGFFPYGFSGVIKGAAACFYGFIGFDCIATAGEEARNPRKSIPFAVCASLAIIFLAYFSISTVLTMMLPYYDQDENAPLPHVFHIFGWTVAEYIVSIGAMFGLCASLMGSMFPLPRIVFAMASDGLLFEFMGKIHPRFKTPFIGTLLTGTLTGLLAAVFNLTQLIHMMSIGTLLAYTMVASCVLILRYENDDKNRNQIKTKSLTIFNIWSELFNFNNKETSTKITSSISMWSITIYCFSCCLFAAAISYIEEHYENIETLHIILAGCAAIPVIFTIIIVARQPKSENPLAFRVPLVPWLPAISILINIYLMLKLDIMTWKRFGIWIGIGLFIYIVYGAWHSKEGRKNERAPFVTGRTYSLSTVSNNSQTISTHF